MSRPPCPYRGTRSVPPVLPLGEGHQGVGPRHREGYQVTAVGEDADGNVWIGAESGGISVILNPSVVSAGGSPVAPVIPARVVPHPFRGRATLSMNVTEPGPVSVRVYDVGGREVLMAEPGWQPAGEVEVTIPGAGLAPGVYVYEMEAANARFRGRLVRLE